jgi:hypothetical protein
MTITIKTKSLVKLCNSVELRAKSFEICMHAYDTYTLKAHSHISKHPSTVPPVNETLEYDYIYYCHQDDCHQDEATDQSYSRRV